MPQVIFPNPVHINGWQNLPATKISMIVYNNNQLSFPISPTHLIAHTNVLSPQIFKRICH